MWNALEELHLKSIVIIILLSLFSLTAGALFGVGKAFVVILVGATTHNPFFSITSALVSRSQLFQFEAITAEEYVILSIQIEIS